MIWNFFLLTFLASYGFTKSVNSNDPCDESKTSFFVTDNASLKSSDFIVFKETSEENCLRTCVQNRDQFGKKLTCNSFTYDHASFSCTIYKSKAAPAGAEKIEEAHGKRYFEKFCIAQDFPPNCQNSQFIRVDQSVLVGYAVNMTLTDSIESCVAQCVKETDCKSAMYFYQDGECITNKESALTKPAGFTKEQEDRVIYFQNGCYSGVSDTKRDSQTPETEQVSVFNNMETGSGENIEDDSKPVVNIQISETTPTSAQESNEKQVSHETNDQEEEYEESFEDSDETESEMSISTALPATDTTPETTTTSKPGYVPENKIKSLLQKKIKKHPKNFASKTYEILKNQETLKKIKNNSFGLQNEIVEEVKTGQSVETYFSDWSDWTPCTKSQERQVRRRRCLNLRKCLGALMQVQNCPTIVPTPAPENSGSVRSIVSVDGNEYDEPIAVDNIFVDPVSSDHLPLSTTIMWGPWQGSCQQFASSQPCNNGNMIGFESRECIAKDPSQCEGPFFRYCTLNC